MMEAMFVIIISFLVFDVISLCLQFLFFFFILFKFSSAAKQAVLYGDQESLSEAMKKMKSFFKFWGILIIVLLGFYALAIISAIVAGVGANMA